jgi:riboflavin synthase
MPCEGRGGFFMFTGVIKAIGVVEAFEQNSSILTISCPLFARLKPDLGASIAIDGVCLTVSHLTKDSTKTIGFDLGLETKSVSLLTHKKPLDLVNIEPALALGDPLDGHMVQGHVDGIGKLVSIKSVEQGALLTFSFEKNLAPYMIKKGSVAIDGVSLTINEIKGNTLSVCLVPHTMEHTTFKAKQVGCLVHIETDIVGRYIHGFYTQENSYPSLSEDIRS